MWPKFKNENVKTRTFLSNASQSLQRIVVGPSESKSKSSSSATDSKASRVVVTKGSSGGKPTNRVVIGSLPDLITPSRLKELLAGIGPIQVCNPDGCDDCDDDSGSDNNNQDTVQKTRKCVDR